jgi:hypothetical protein
MRNYIEDKTYNVVVTATTRPAGNLRQECEHRARLLYETYGKPLICFSGGVDSQVAVYSFLAQNIPFECVFLHLPGYNDNELTNVRIMESKWNISCKIITIDVDASREELLKLSIELDTEYNGALQHMFVDKLQYDGLVINYGVNGPWLFTDEHTNEHLFYAGYTGGGFTRLRAMSKITSSKVIKTFYNEYITLCLLDDKVTHDFFSIEKYFSGPVSYVGHTAYRYEVLIKPWLFFKYYGSELEYFGKFAGYEKIDWILSKASEYQKVGPHLLIPIPELITHLRYGEGTDKTWSSKIK